MRIRWTEPAARDLTNICDYTEEHDGPEAARRAALRIYEALGTLTSQALASLCSPAFLFWRCIAWAKRLSKSIEFSTARRNGHKQTR